MSTLRHDDSNAGFANFEADGHAEDVHHLPVVSQITEHLFVGSWFAPNASYDVIVNVSQAPNERPESFKGLYVSWPLEDEEGFELDQPVLEALGRFLYNLLFLEKRVLVHCQAGLNRSALVAAYALVCHGHRADDVIRLIREKRDLYCLCNRAFEREVRRFGADYWAPESVV